MTLWGCQPSPEPHQNRATARRACANGHTELALGPPRTESAPHSTSRRAPRPPRSRLRAGLRVNTGRGRALRSERPCSGLRAGRRVPHQMQPHDVRIFATGDVDVVRGVDDVLAAVPLAELLELDDRAGRDLGSPSISTSADRKSIAWPSKTDFATASASVLLATGTSTIGHRVPAWPRRRGAPYPWPDVTGLPVDGAAVEGLGDAQDRLLLLRIPAANLDARELLHGRQAEIRRGASADPGGSGLSRQMTSAALPLDASA
jgi:hypothetical protein